MKLQDLTGRHVLDGVDAKLRRLSNKNSNVLSFRLDGVVYSATEEDAELDIVDNANIDNFDPVEVIASYNDNGVWSLIDAGTGRPVIEIGLFKNQSAYSLIRMFDSTAMSINN